MKPSLLQKPLLSVPTGVDPRKYYLCLLGPLALGLSVGIQAAFVGLLTLGPTHAPSFPVQLTEYAKEIAHPERDLLVFVAGMALALTAACGFVLYWRAWLSRIEFTKARQGMEASALVQGLLAGISAAVFLLLIGGDWFSLDFRSIKSGLRPPTGTFAALRMLVPALVAVLCAVTDLRGRSGQCGVRNGTGSAHHAPDRTAHSALRSRLSALICYAVPVFIVLALGMPPGQWAYVAGQVFVSDGNHHLNFFFVGPALGFAHGQAFGTGIYSQYGIGWPLLASLLSHVFALTYANLIGLVMIYGCVYYVGLFCLLRACFARVPSPESPVLSPETQDSGLKAQDSGLRTQDRVRAELWAAFGALLALCWQMFSGVGPGQVNLAYPSSTMMRHSMDVWFFLALVNHQRSGRLLWAVLAGIVAGLGVFFETETGVYLLLCFLIYMILQTGVALDASRRASWKGLLVAASVFAGAALATLLPLLLYASRGTLFGGAFWRGWLEAMVRYPSLGFGFLPIAEVPDGALFCFTAMIAVYFGVIAYVLLRVLHRDATNGMVLLATVAAYGLALLLLFVGRSHPFNLCHATPAFAVLVTALLFGAWNRLGKWLPNSPLPCALTVGLIVLFMTKPQFASYPSLIGSLFQRAPAEGLCLRSKPMDACGLPSTWAGFIREAQDISTAIRGIAPDGQDVAVVDLNDTLICSLADCGPWSRYSPLYFAAVTQESVEGIRNELIARAPRYVVIRGEAAPRPAKWDFLWAPLHAVVTQRYVLSRTVGPWGIWKARPPSPAAAPAVQP